MLLSSRGIMTQQTEIECCYCGLLQRRIGLLPGQSARCVGCTLVLYREKPGGIERALTLTVASLLLLAIANFSVFMTFEFAGRDQGNRIISGVGNLIELGYAPLGLLIFFASVLAPLLHLSGFGWVLWQTHRGRAPSYLGPLYRHLEILRPWAMLEVYLLGIFVAVIKLSQLANIDLGAGFWAYLGLIVTSTASYDAVDSREIWNRLPIKEERVPA